MKTKCGLCGHEFDETQAESACKNCPVMKGCPLIKCPRCGFEWPPEPEWIKKLKERRK
ncbi:MAG: hypothetical protein AB1498_06630 [bacterium]